jgi:hypothetical protein
MCVFKSLSDVGSYENRNACFNNDKGTGNEELMLVIFNGTLLHSQND